MSFDVLERAALLVHVAATWFMTGLIWFVQVVHYPLMGRVGASAFRDYALIHARRTGWVVAPPMLAEAGTGLLLALRPPRGVAPGSTWIGLALLVAIWLSTAVLQVPAHRRLASGFDAATHRGLVAGNRIRTAAWTARALLVAGWLA